MSYRILQKIGRLKMTDLLLNLHQETHILAYFGIPYFGNLFNIDENETNIDENDMMAVVEVGRPIFVTTSSESGRRRPLSQASELGRTSTQEITGISDVFLGY